LPDLPAALRTVNGLGAALRDITDAVELGAVPAIPEGLKRDGFAVRRISGDLFGNYSKGTTNPCKARRLGKTARLNGNFAGTLNFINGMRNRFILNKRFISRIKQNNGFMGKGIINPFFQLLACRNRTGRIVGITEINQIHRLLGNIGDKIVFGCTGHINNSAVAAGIVCRPRPAGHHIGIHIYRIDRVSHGSHIVQAEDFLQIADVAFGTVADKDFVRRDLRPSCLKVVFGNGFPQKLIALFRTIAAEGLPTAHFPNGLVHGLADGLRQRLRNISDTKSDEGSIGMSLGKSRYTTADFRKQIAGPEL